MQKKKSEAKLNLPSVGVRPTETSKNYASKNTISKCREVDEKNIYFEMPSIHQGDLTLKAFIEGEERPLHKLQSRILRYFESAREGRMWEEWDHYMKKSEILSNRNIEFSELQDFLVKTVYRIVAKLTSLSHSTSFSFNKTLRSSENIEYDSKEGSEIYNKTAFIEDKILDEDSKMYRKLSKSAGEEAKEQIDPISSLNQQNVLLEKKVEIYEKRIEELTRALSRFEEKENSTMGEKDTTNEMMQIVSAKNKYKYESEVKSMHIESLSRELKNAKDSATTFKGKLQDAERLVVQLKGENTKFRQFLKYKELWQMASEEAYSWHGKFTEEREEKQRCSSKIKLLKEKNKQLLNYFNMSNAVNPDQEEDKQDLDKIIKEFKDWLMIISVPKAPSQLSEKLQDSQERMSNTEEVNVKLIRPNFYIFFQAFENTLLVEKNIINIRPIEYNFFLKIRVIFDTMFRQFLISNSYKDYPSFPQFVIGFLQKYQVNPETGKVEYRRKPIQNEEKITFLVNLFNKNFCNTWECEIFKSFLFENYYLDEIFFFLQCRNEFNGGTPSSNVLGSVDPISYVKLSKALKVVAKQLAPYENYIVEKVKNILKSKKKVKYGQAFIDKHFVLKLLLEVYALERAKSERIFESSFNLKMKKSYITFGDFHHFMNKNFPFTTSIQIAQLYRQVYTLSSGHVTHKAIHYICGSKGLFIPLMLEKRVNRSGLEKSLGGDMLLLDIQNVITKMVGQLQDFGEESFIGFEHSLNGFMRQLEFYKGNKAIFYQRLYQQKCNVLRINTLVELAASYELSAGEAVQDLQLQTRMIQLHSLLHQTDTQVHLLGRQKEKRAKAWKMLVRNFKIRIQESILQFQKVNEDEINKLREQIQKTNINKESELQAQLQKEKTSQSKINS